MQDVRWRFIEDDWTDGAYHMAVDEAVLTLCARGESPPTLRSYNFWPLCLSLGRFQSARREVNQESCYRRGIEVIRRPTGGRAVLHQNDIAYSVVAPTGDPHIGRTVRETYQCLASVLAETLRLIGAEGVAVNDGRGSVSTSGLCFQSLAPYDITVGGLKVIGSAQVRRRGAVLQHGSIRLMGGGHPMHRIMHLPPMTARDQDTDIGLREILGLRLTRHQVAQALHTAFGTLLGIELVPGVLTAEEGTLTQKLVEEKYANPHWNWNR